ncbi:ABC transporter ATP-binding protein [Vagococcus fluvialis]|uniref:ABC transporter ATP-binding protein n=1 Tax=Vagococcus fluvialis TaxID=2738 RepID=UPI003B216F91
MAKKNTFRTDEELTKSFSLSDFKRLGTYIKPYKKQVTVILIIIILSNMIAMLGPYFMKITLDNYIPNQEKTKILQLGVIYLLSLILISWSMKYRILKITELGQKILKDMRSDIFIHIQKLSFSYYDSRPHGKILIRVVNYINTLSDLLSNGLINFLSDFINMVITLIVMFTIDTKLALYSLVFLPFLVIATLVIQKFQRVAYQTLSNKQSNLTAYIHESIAGVRITQSFTKEEKKQETFEELSNEYRTSWMKAVKIMRLLWPAVELTSIFTICFLYYVGAKQIGIQVTIGTLIAFMAYMSNFWNPIINIGNFYNQLVTATAYLERIFETLDEEPTIIDAPDAIELPEIEGNVTFEHVSFQYEANSPKVLNDLSFHVEAGKNIALVGPTGAGKTTVINLINRFYDVTDGSVKVDGYDVRGVTLNSLRRQIGVMLQDTFVFSGTILENIRYGKLDATEKEIIAASKVVRAHDFINKLPNGYHTIVEERGSTLSAGQRQLISFARVLLADPKILILDEATANIDTETEELLQKGLNELLKNRTSFIIAHRLSTIKNSDEIFVIDKGKVQESGNHDELLKTGGHYSQLYYAQFAANQD